MGTDLAAAKKAAGMHNDPGRAYGTVQWWFGEFLTDCKLRVSAGSLSQRTLDDYAGYADYGGPLLAYFGRMFPDQIKPSHVQKYLEDNAALGRPTPANRERACLSSMLSWLIRTGRAADGFTVNPCMRASGVRRNAESPRQRYVTDAEYRAVYDEAADSVKLAMELVYRTLQRPEVDVLSWTPANIKQKDDNRVLSFVQSKTGRKIEIALVGVLEDLVTAAVGQAPVLHQPIIHTRRGTSYTYTGLGAMLRRSIERVKATHQAANGPLAEMQGFGLRDLKGKGATDMYVAGESIERIQQLCGHADKSTTEIYIKQRWLQTAQPNLRQIA